MQFFPQKYFWVVFFKRLRRVFKRFDAIFVHYLFVFSSVAARAIFLAEVEGNLKVKQQMFNNEFLFTQIHTSSESYPDFNQI
jgi:cell division protein FtsI/penicillin-binding protein 2